MLPHFQQKLLSLIIGNMAAVLRWSILSALIALAVAACSGERELVPNTLEEDLVQAGMDVMMADREITSVTPNTHSTNSWIDNPTGAGTNPLYPSYSQDPETTCYYCWDSTGLITRQDKSSAKCGGPSGGAATIPPCLVQKTDVSNDPFWNMTDHVVERVAVVVAAIILLGTFKWLRRKRSD